MRGDYEPPMPPARRPLIVRLRNWVGDVTLGLPLLQRLADEGHDLQLVGKGWARELLAGHGWPVHVLPKTWRERVALLRRLKAQALAQDPGFGSRALNALCLPYSFSSALEFRWAGLRALGYAYEGRSLLLKRAMAKPRGLHELQVYWALGNELQGRVAEPPAAIDLKVSATDREAAQALRAAHGLEAACIVICPFAGGTFSKLDKTWPGFADFAAHALPQFGRSVVVCPGPGEEALAHSQFASARVLTGVKLGVYAALLQDAAVMVANDTGPGHIAAAVGTPLVSVLGPTDAGQWRAWGPTVHVLQGAGTWPEPAQVQQAVARILVV